MGNLLFSPKGRISKKNYWIGIAILIGVSIVVSYGSGALGMAGAFIGFLLNLLLIYVSVCVYGKRLHDFGKSAWLYAALLILTIIVTLVMVMGPILSLVSANPEIASDEAAMNEAMASILSPMKLLLLYIPSILFTIWVGVKNGDDHENQYGPEPTV